MGSVFPWHWNWNVAYLPQELCQNKTKTLGNLCPWKVYMSNSQTTTSRISQFGFILCHMEHRTSSSVKRRCWPLVTVLVEQPEAPAWASGSFARAQKPYALSRRRCSSWLVTKLKKIEDNWKQYDWPGSITKARLGLFILVFLNQKEIHCASCLNFSIRKRGWNGALSKRWVAIVLTKSIQIIQNRECFGLNWLKHPALGPPILRSNHFCRFKLPESVKAATGKTSRRLPT